MSDIQVLLFCCLISFITICIVYVMNKATSARLYKDLVEPVSALPKSPYSLSREKGGGNTWGYCITKNGEVMYSDGSAQVMDLDTAIKQLNIIERIEGVKPTKLR